MPKKFTKTVALIVAHPDDETIWAGGMILSHPSWKCFVVCLSHANDLDRASKFNKALEILKSKGIMGDLDDSSDQKPLDEKVIEDAIVNLLPDQNFDLLISHNPSGEQTGHLRHQEVSKAVIKLWYTNKISARELWTFAYEDGNKQYYPRPVENADVYHTLTKHIWHRKYIILTETYGFEKGIFEEEASLKAEAFWKFTDPYIAHRWTKNGGVMA